MDDDERQQEQAAVREQLRAATEQNKRQLAATLRGVQVLRSAADDGPDPKLVAMSKLHMLGEVLTALFERLHARDAGQFEREAALRDRIVELQLQRGPTPMDSMGLGGRDGAADDEGGEALDKDEAAPSPAPRSPPAMAASEGE